MTNKKGIKHRILWIDYMKAICITLVVIGHACDNQTVLNFIYAFHVPCFFVISGYFEKDIRSINCGLKIKSSIRRLIVPYFFFSLVGLTTCWISPYVHPELYYNVDFSHSIINAIVGMLIMDDYVTPWSYLPVVPLWFLVSLFTCNVLLAILSKILSNNCAWTRNVLLATFVIALCALYQPQIHYFSIDSSALGFIFYFSGYVLRRMTLKLEKLNIVLMIVLIPVAAILLMALSQINGFVSIDGGHTGRFFGLFLVNAFLGVLLCALLALFMERIFKRLPILSVVGESTLCILGLHYSVLYMMKFLLAMCKVNIHPMSFWVSLTISVVAVLACLPIAYMLKKYVPWSVGIINK